MTSAHPVFSHPAFSLSAFLILNAVAVLALVPSAGAQTFITGNPDGRAVSIPVSPSMAGSKLVVAVVGKRADDQNLRLSIEGPTGLTLSLKGMTVKRASEVKQNYTRLARAIGATTRISNDTDSSFPAQPGTAVGVGGAGDELDPNCGCISKSMLNTLLAINPLLPRSLLCGSFEPRASCEGFGGSGPGAGGGVTPVATSSGQARASVAGFIETNRCLSGGKPAAAIELDLSGVVASDLNGTIEIKTEMFTFGGNRRASIKPRSDGGIFPGQPLLLVGPVGGADQVVNLLKYSGSRRTSSQALAYPRTGGSIFYRGNTYLRFPIGKYMTGGRGVFQIAGGGQGYSLCVRLVRERQRFNGYVN